MPTDDRARSRSVPPVKRRLGEILVAGGAVTADQLAHALTEQAARQLPLGQTLIALGYTTDEVMRQALSSQLGVPYIDLKNVIIDRSLAPLLDREFARQHVLFPVARVGRMLTLALDDPTASHVVEEVARQTGHEVTIVTSSHDGIHRALARMYEGTARPDDVGAPAPPRTAAPGRSGTSLDHVSLLGLQVSAVADLIRAIDEGLTADAFDTLVETAGLNRDLAAAMADITPETLSARRAGGRFTRDESDRLGRVARVVGSVLALFQGDRTTTQAWLQSAQPMLGGASPADLVRTDPGTREVERVLAHLKTTARA